MSCQNCNQTVLPTTTISGPPGSDGQNGANGLWGGVCAHYQFSASTSGADPGPGLLSFDSSLLSLSTHLYINHNDIVGTDLANFISSLGIPNNSVKALLRVTSSTDESLFALFEINDVTPLSGHTDLDITYLDGSTNPFSPGDDILFCPALSGDSTFNLQTLSPDFTTGIDYPASTVGDVYRILTPGWVGTTAAVEPPGSIRVFKDDMLFCIANTPGGDQATAGASFFVFSAPRAFVPESTTNGDDNYVINTDGLTNNVISTSNRTVIIGNSNSVTGSNQTLMLGASLFSTDSTGNFIVGAGLNLTDSDNNILLGTGTALNNSFRNIVGGNQNSATDSDNNLIVGTLHSLPGVIQGDNNLIAGTANKVTGSNGAIIGAANEMAATAGGVNFSGYIGGNGAYANIINSLTLGACDNPQLFSGKGSFQTMIVPLSGIVNDVSNPSASFITLSANAFGGANSLLAIPNNSVWYYDLNYVVVQSAVGNDHTNTSLEGDTVGYEVTGAIMNLGGSISHIYQKWKNARGQFINIDTPTDTTPYVRRFVKYDDGSQADIQIVKPVVTNAGANLSIRAYFPGFQGVMPSSGLTEPEFGEAAAGVTLTGDGVTTGAIAAPAIATATYRNPLVDIYGGYGLQGGSGMGALATAELTPTTVANNLYICSGGTNYTDGDLLFSSGDALGTYTTTAGVITGVSLTTGGLGVYTTPPTITFSDPGGLGIGASVIAYLTPTNVDNLDVTDSGAGYTAIPNAVVYDGGDTQCGAGNGGSFVSAGTIKITQVKF